MNKRRKTNDLDDQIKAGAKRLIDDMIGYLKEKDVPPYEIRIKTGSFKDEYILTVRTPFGTRFARLGLISLINQEDTITQEVNHFILRQLAEKLVVLKEKKACQYTLNKILS